MGKKSYPVISPAIAGRLMMAEKQQAQVLALFRHHAGQIYAGTVSQLFATEDGVTDLEGITDQLLEVAVASQYAANIFMQSVGLPPVKISCERSGNEQEASPEISDADDPPSTIVLP
jgi:hypothetical protein